jgi:hypothetical protein
MGQRRSGQSEATARKTTEGSKEQSNTSTWLHVVVILMCFTKTIIMVIVPNKN